MKAEQAKMYAALATTAHDNMGFGAFGRSRSLTPRIRETLSDTPNHIRRSQQRCPAQGTLPSTVSHICNRGS